MGLSHSMTVALFFASRPESRRYNLGCDSYRGYRSVQRQHRVIGRDVVVCGNKGYLFALYAASLWVAMLKARGLVPQHRSRAQEHRSLSWHCMTTFKPDTMHGYLLPILADTDAE